MTAATAHEALAVLGRTAGWLARDGNVSRARYVEATLGRWATLPLSEESPLSPGFAAIREAILGFDAEPEEARRARVETLLAQVDALRAQLGAVEAPAHAPRAVLLPEGVISDLPPKFVAPAPPTAEAVEGGAVRAAERREGGEERRERGDERRDQRREERGRRRDERAARRDERRSDAAPREEAPAPAVEAPRPPPSPPEPRTFPLGHPEGTGEPLEALGVFDAAERTALAAADVATVADLLLRPPTSTERAGERWIPGVTPEGPVIVRGTVRARYTRFSPGVRRFELLLEHDKGTVACRWVGEVPAEVRAAKPGSEIGLAGLLEVDDERPVLLEAEPLGIDGRGGDWLPRYALAEIDDARLRAGMRAALRKHAETLQDHLPVELLERHRLVSLAQALRDVHFPSNASRKGRSRLGFDELLQVQLGVALLRARERRERGVANSVTHALVSQAHGMAGWHFTDEQEAAFDDIRRDLRRNQPMARLIQGDVGVGKHAVVQAAMLTVAEGKHQALFLAPDALSAEHRYLFAEAFYKSVGIEPMLLTGAPTRAQVEQIKKGEALVIYATHALVRDVPAFRKLGLVVFEEQGVYGAADSAPFDVQGQRPDLLVFTPTPVPSALALNLYGQLAMTVIANGAAGGVDTSAYDAGQRDDAYALARAAIEAGQQVMIVFPVLRGQDLLSPSEARRLAEVLAAETFPGARVGIFNGGMSREERFRAYDDFQHRRSEVLLATTYVEHGPIVPNAAVMIVEQAQQFDLVRLHRLRGHVGQGWRRGQCLLVVGDDPRPEARHNIDLLLRETDGFRVAELDLRHRGIEAALGDRVAEAPDFAWADPVQERDLLVKTRQEAVRLLNGDPGLKRRAHRALLNLVRSRFGEDAIPDGSGAPPAAGGGDAQGRRRRRRRGR